MCGASNAPTCTMWLRKEQLLEVAVCLCFCTLRRSANVILTVGWNYYRIVMYINQQYCSGRFHWTGGNIVGSRSSAMSNWPIWPLWWLHRNLSRLHAWEIWRIFYPACDRVGGGVIIAFRDPSLTSANETFMSNDKNATNPDCGTEPIWMLRLKNKVGQLFLTHWKQKIRGQARLSHGITWWK